MDQVKNCFKIIIYTVHFITGLEIVKKQHNEYFFFQE